MRTITATPGERLSAGTQVLVDGRMRPPVRPDRPLRPGRHAAQRLQAGRGASPSSRTPVRGLGGLAVALAAVLLSAATLRAGSIDVFLYTTGDLAAATVTAGSTLPLYTWLSTTDSPGVGGLFYTVECPDTSWSLATRDYVTYGWQDGTLYDRCTPTGDVSFPVDITNALFNLTPSTADFTFENSLADFGSTITGGTIETFALVVPNTPGVYTLHFGALDALDAAGAALTGDVGHDFMLTVAGPVPEPSAVLLLGLAGVALVGQHRRRRGHAAVHRARPRRQDPH